MIYEVILSRENDKFIARAKEWPEVMVVENSRDAAINQLKAQLLDYLTNKVEIVQVDIPLVAKKEDPSFDDLQAEDKANRLWEYLITEQEIFNNRLNFFLAVETILLSSLAVIIGQGNSINNYEKLLTLFLLLGLSLTIIWVYIQARQNCVLSVVRERAHLYLPDIKETQKQIDSRLDSYSRRCFIRRIRIRHMLSYVIPSIFLIVWIFLPVLLFIL